jgi:DNA/RNA endonuclease G (NUC1)
MEIAFDTRTKCPVYVLERLQPQEQGSSSKENSAQVIATDSSANAKGQIQDVSSGTHKKRRHYFRQESSVPPRVAEQHFSRKSHYKHSGYDRGHMAPAADFEKDDDKSTTYTLANICPQVPSFNRTLWVRLENLVRRIALEESSSPMKNSTTYVVTGPLWLPTQKDSNNRHFRMSFDAIGVPPSLVSVPTHFFKVILVVDEDDPTTGKAIKGNTQMDGDKGVHVRVNKFAAFVMPNAEPQESTSKKGGQRKSLDQYLVKLSDLETVSGLHFFPHLLHRSIDDHMGARWADQLTEDQWAVIHKHMDGVDLFRQIEDGGAPIKQNRVKRKKADPIQKMVHICQKGRCS